MKKIVSFLALLFLLLPSVANAYDAEINGIYYNFISENGAEVTDGDTEYSGAVVIPESVTYRGKTYNVTGIGEYAFEGCESLTSVIIPSRVTVIGEGAFAGCESLTSVTIPNSVTTIGEYAFNYCPSLTSVTFGNSVTTIGESAFADCESLTSVTIPNSVTSIGICAFNCCESLASVTIPNGVTSIGEGAFASCISLTSIAIPESVTRIGDGAFISCINLTKVTLNIKTIGNGYSPIQGIFGEQVQEYILGDNVTRISDYAFIASECLTSIVIPNSVTSIGNEAFEGCFSLTSVTIGNGVTRIGYGAFGGCIGLTSVTIPASVTRIGEGAFDGCFFAKASFINNSSLKDEENWGAILCDEETSEGLLILDKIAVYCRPWASSVTIPDSVTGIGEGAFSDCSNLASVTIPQSMTSIGNQAFSGCSGLTSVTIPESVTSIGNKAFSGCSGLTSVNIPEGVTTIGEEAFSGCTSLTSVNIPECVTSIGKNVFYNCSGLTSVIIGSGVTSIGWNAFYGCNNLTSVTVESETPATIESTSFPNRGNANLYVPYGSRNTYRSASYWKDFKTITEWVPEIAGVCYIINGGEGTAMVTSHYEGNYEDDIVIPETITYKGKTYSVTSIGSYAFSGCSGLTSVTIPNSVTSINSYAFSRCSGLTSITIPNSVTSIGNNAFFNCSSLTSVTIGNSVTSIDYEAFRGCSGLTSVTIPNSVTSIGGSAFSGCSGLTDVTIPNSVTSIGGSAFSGCSGLTSVTIGSGVTSIGSSAFQGCSGLTDVSLESNAIVSANRNSSQSMKSVFGDQVELYVIGNSVESIGSSAFSGCSGLTSVTIGSGVTSIGNSAFYNCTSLTSVIIGNSVTIIGSGAFCYCSGLTDVTIPNSVTSIGGSAFSGCSGLTSVTIPNSVTSIGNSAFYNCTSLTSVIIGNSVTSIGGSAFQGCSGLTDVTIPNSVTSIGRYAFSSCSGLTSVISYIEEPFAISSVFDSDTYNNAILYVPIGSIDAYQNTNGWKDFKNIKEFRAGGCSIAISLPEGISAQDYSKMYIELTNTESGQKLHYVLTDRTTYTFANIPSNTSWNIILRNERGDIFGQIDNVEVKDEDVSVAFSSLSKPQSVVLSVLTPDGQDVTAQTQITWANASGNYFAQGASLTGLPVGYQVTYSVALPQELAMTYATLQPADYVLTDGSNSITCQLDSIPRVQLSGKVKDAGTGLPLNGAIVSASQTFGGKYTRMLTAKTDSKGVFTLEVANVPTTITFAATDYVSQTVNYDNGLDGLDGFVVPDVSLKPITGATISIDFVYTTVDGETQNWYSDYQNVSFELFNVTKDCAVSQFNVQYPKIVLLEDVEDGDVLRLTATSRTNAFMSVDATATIAEQKAEASFSIKELGKIQATFVTTGNASVVGILYDASGKLVNTSNYSNASLTISDLADGNYTLVSMGSSRLFNSIYDLAQLPQTGLAEGTDYVKNRVEVKSGEVSYISIGQVPTLDESKLYYTGTGTSFTVNKPSIVAGNYLTLTGYVDFKPEYAANVNDVQLIIDLPESCEFIENSVMVGISTSGYMIDGNRITIPMADYTDRVRLCAIPTLGGDYAPSALVQFKLNGETIMQPIGSANYTAKDLSISVPQVVAKTSVPISGTAIGQSQVEIYDNDVLIGQTTSLANGTWQTTCDLNEPYNLSRHQIYAKVTTKAGMKLQSEIAECLYDMNSIEPRTVTMSFYNGWLKKNVEVVFDLQNKSLNSSSYMFYTTTDITFVADLTNNDSTVVKDVTIRVYTDKKKWYNLDATYNKSLDRWVAVRTFGSGELPIGVTVNVDAESNTVVDAQYFKDIEYSFNELCEDYKNDGEIIESAETEEEIQDMLDAMGINLFPSLESDTTAYQDYLEGLSIEELRRLVNEERDIDLDYLDTLTTIKAQLDALMEPAEELNQLMNDGTKVYLGGCDGLTVEELESKGFDKTLTTEGYYVYSLVTDRISEYVCFETNTHYKLEYSDGNSSRMNARQRSIEGSIESILSWGAKIDDALNRVQDGYNAVIDLLGDWPKKLDDALAQASKDKSSYYKKWQECHQLEISLTRGINSGEFSAAERQLAEDHIKSLQRAQNKYNNAIAEINKKIKYYPQLIKGAGRLLSTFNRVLPFTKYISLANDAKQNIQTFVGLYNRIPDCPKYPNKKRELQVLTTSGAGVIIGALVTKLGVEAVADMAAAGQMVAAPATGGASLLSGFITMVGEILFGLAMDAAYNWTKERTINGIENAIANAQKDCNEEDDDDDDDDNPPYPTIDPIHDPSGFVYEGVPSNRLQGVTATAYYKEMVEDMYGDEQENIVKWDASEYAQENPLFTDEYGFYRWDVPQGLWQVKFEKEGYETTYSDWLPVPPPQLDINIPMKQAIQPEVKEAHAYEDGVEVTFDKYMMPEQLTKDNILVSQDGEDVKGEVVLMDEETTPGDESVKYASRVRFVPETPFRNGEVTLFVANRVRSYADVPMQDNYEQTFTIEKEVKEIVADSLVKVLYGGTETIIVDVLPAEAAAGKTLTVKTSSPMIMNVEKENYVIDEDGQAAITVTGELPGTAALTFSVEGTDKTATTIVNVEQAIFATISAPTASIASGSLVQGGTQITLSCETEGATIYYTTDGSCPCDENGSRMVYDGTPIVITKDVTIKAMAVAPDGAESEVVEFVYVVGTGIDGLSVDDDVQVYPLRVHDKLNVTAGGKLIKSVTVSSTSGTAVAASGKPSAKVTLDVSHIPAGIYIVAVTTEKGSYSCKIVKEQ